MSDNLVHETPKSATYESASSSLLQWRHATSAFAILNTDILALSAVEKKILLKTKKYFITNMHTPLDMFPFHFINHHHNFYSSSIISFKNIALEETTAEYEFNSFTCEKKNFIALLSWTMAKREIIQRNLIQKKILSELERGQKNIFIL